MFAQMCPMKTEPAAVVQGLGERLRRRRKALGLRQQELADLAEVSVRFVHDVEHGKPTVQLAQLLRVLDALGLRLTITTGHGPLIDIDE